MPGFRVRVLYDYDAQQPDELSIRVDDVIENVEFVESGWYSGVLRGARGVFPDNFVERMKDANSNANTSSSAHDSKAQARKGRWFCRVLFDYEPEAIDELQLVVGDVIEVLCEVEDGWWRGRLNDKVGFVTCHLFM
jgi:hypothetical protein